MTDDTVVKNTDHERRIQDAATMLLDACLAAIPATEQYPTPEECADLGLLADLRWREAQVISLAGQALCMADIMDPAAPADKRIAKIDVNVLLSRAYGIGLALGHLTASIDTVDHATDFLVAVIGGYESAIEAREARGR